MKINYILTKDDILAFYRKVMLKNSFFFRNYIFVVALVLSVFLAFYDKYSNPTRAAISIYISNYWIYIAISFVFMVAAIHVVRLMVVALLRFQLKNKLGLMGDKRLELLADKVVFLSKSSKIEYLFTSLQRIEEHSKYYFLITTSQAVIIIPKRAIGSDEFVKRLKDQIGTLSN